MPSASRSGNLRPLLHCRPCTIAATVAPAITTATNALGPFAAASRTALTSLGDAAEEQGGAGMGLVELCLVAEEIGHLAGEFLGGRGKAPPADRLEELQVAFLLAGDDLSDEHGRLCGDGLLHGRTFGQSQSSTGNGVSRALVY